jgi:hypothetical protein
VTEGDGADGTPHPLSAPSSCYAGWGLRVVDQDQGRQAGQEVAVLAAGALPGGDDPLGGLEDVDGLIGLLDEASTRRRSGTAGLRLPSQS